MTGLIESRALQRQLVLLFLWLSSVGTAVAAEAAEPILSGVISSAGVDANASSLVIRRLSDGKIWISNRNRAKKRFPPASTSKIPHTLIALESGWAKRSTRFKWDGTVRAIAAWNQDQDLASAYRRSAVWVYQKMTSTLGHRAMQDWIGKLKYGNRLIGSQEQLTTYWLTGPLEISASEQIEFLSRLAKGQLPFSQSTFASARDIMLAERKATWTMYAKTGWRHDGVNTDIGWYVGWVEGIQNGSTEVFVFAFNLDMTSKNHRRARRLIVRNALIRIGAINSP